MTVHNQVAGRDILLTVTNFINREEANDKAKFLGDAFESCSTFNVFDYSRQAYQSRHIYHLTLAWGGTSA